MAFRLLGICGSLKTDSVNKRLLLALAEMLQGRAEVTLYEGLHLHPQFNPENETGNSEVENFRHQIKRAEGVIICTPEYAFGVPGSLKNALDYTVATGEFNDKPVWPVSCSPLPSGGNQAMAALLATLSALGTKVHAGIPLCIANINKKLDGVRVADASTLSELSTRLDTFLETLVD